MKKAMFIGCLIGAFCMMRVMALLDTAGAFTGRVTSETRIETAAEKTEADAEETAPVTEEEQEAVASEQAETEKADLALGELLLGEFSGYTAEDIRHAATINVYDVVKNIYQVKKALPTK